MEYFLAMENYYHVTTISVVATWIGVTDIMLGKKESSGSWVLEWSNHISLVELQKYGHDWLFAGIERASRVGGHRRSREGQLKCPCGNVPCVLTM